MSGYAWRPDRTAWRIAGVRPFDTLISQAMSADVTGWDFGWLDGRATEERPPWGYAGLLAARLATAQAALDIDTGGGEVLSRMPTLPPRMCVTESWPPNAARARKRWHHVASRSTRRVDGSVSRSRTRRSTWSHPGIPCVLTGRRSTVCSRRVVTISPSTSAPPRPSSSSSSSSAPCPSSGRAGTPTGGDERGGGRPHGHFLRTARCRMEFFDIGAVVWTLRKCVWWVP